MGLNLRDQLAPLFEDLAEVVTDLVNPEQCCTTALVNHFHLVDIYTVLSFLLLLLG
mgnify:CR=1 FL=1